MNCFLTIITTISEQNFIKIHKAVSSKSLSFVYWHMGVLNVYLLHFTSIISKQTTSDYKLWTKSVQ